MASTTAPADIIPCGGRESTQMAAATTNSPPKLTAAESQPNWDADRPSRSEAMTPQKAPEPPATSNAAATTSRNPELEVGVQVRVQQGAIITIRFRRCPAQMPPGITFDSIRARLRWTPLVGQD